MKTFKLSTDPDFMAKVRDVAGLCILLKRQIRCDMHSSLNAPQAAITTFIDRY